jgi:hypothetical protein
VLFSVVLDADPETPVVSDSGMDDEFISEIGVVGTLVVVSDPEEFKVTDC